MLSRWWEPWASQTLNFYHQPVARVSVSMWASILPVFIVSPLPESSFCPCSSRLPYEVLPSWSSCCEGGNPTWNPTVFCVALALSLLHWPTSFRQDLYPKHYQQEGGTHPASQSFLAFKVLIKWWSGGKAGLTYFKAGALGSSLVCATNLLSLCTLWAQFSHLSNEPRRISCLPLH